jgi:hypothetical protein
MSDNSIQASSEAYIVDGTNNSPVIILNYANVETLIAKLLVKYFRDMDFPSIFNNFGNLNISNSHPFAAILYTELAGQEPQVNSMFPSITINDSSDSQDDIELGSAYEEFVLYEKDYLNIKNKVEQNLITCSDTGLERLRIHFENNNSAAAYKNTVRSKNQIDFNIWSENKEVTSFLYDTCKQFMYLYNKDLKKEGIKFMGNMSGRRSGDYNMDFGMLLYGANLTVPISYDQSGLVVDVKIHEIDSIEISPDFHAIVEE